MWVLDRWFRISFSVTFLGKMFENFFSSSLIRRTVKLEGLSLEKPNSDEYFKVLHSHVLWPHPLIYN